MPAEPEPTPRKMKRAAEDDGQQEEDALRVHAQPAEEELVLPARVARVALLRRRRRRGYASIRLRAALAVLRTSCHSLLSLPVAGLALDDRLEDSGR